MKHILCAFRNLQSDMLEEIHDYAGKHDWSLEITGLRIPPGWFGDGVMTDYIPLEKLRNVRGIEHIPVVALEIHPEPNVRSVVGDTNRIAELVYRHCSAKGYTVFAAVDAREWPGGTAEVPQDPNIALRHLLDKEGIPLHFCCWQPDLKPDELADYAVVIEKLREFFSGLPKPAALFVSNSMHLAVVYRVLGELGLRVPEDIAVLCNTESPAIADSAPIPTSRISGAGRERGRKMCDLMNRMLNGEEIPKTPVYVSPAAIVPRLSTDSLILPDAHLTTAINFLQNNFAGAISVDDAADRAGISSCMLHKKFLKYLNKTPYQFLLELRINRIRDLLDGTSLTLEQIAEQTGYGSKMALSLAFKRMTGVTPGAYRQQRLLKTGRNRRSKG